MSLANISVYPFQPVSGGGEPMSPEYGINLRQHYAGLAMQGQVAMGGLDISTHEYFAMKAVAQADALLAALETTP